VLALAPLLMLAPAATAEESLDVQVLCTVEHRCRVKLVPAAGEPVITSFLSDRLDPDGRWPAAEVYGELHDAQFVGLFHMRFSVVDDAGTFRSAIPSDPPEGLLVHEVALALDAKGHVTFFFGALHRPGESQVMRSYLWGHPPGVAVVPELPRGGRAMPVPRVPPPATGAGRTYKVRILNDADTEEAVVRVIVSEAGRTTVAETAMRTNVISKRGAYAPAASTSDVADSPIRGLHIRAFEQDVVGPGGRIVSSETMTAVVDFDEHAIATFFLGLVAGEKGNQVRKAYVWGYPPGVQRGL